MKKRLLTLGAAALLLLAGAAPALAAHDFEGQCETCHLSDPHSATLLFTDNIETLCRNCHEMPTQNVHPTGVVPTMAMPAGFRLDAEGKLTCATCHDPHQSTAEERPHLLRGSENDVAFCRQCHPEVVTAEKRHQSAVFLAHAHSTPATDSTDQLDSVSSACVSCHDGTGGKMVLFCVLGQPGQCSSHVVGANYQRATARTQSLLPSADLSPLIALYEGKVSCVSCHSIYSHNTKQLVLSNEGSRLCSGCHKK